METVFDTIIYDLRVHRVSVYLFGKDESGKRVFKSLPALPISIKKEGKSRVLEIEPLMESLIASLKKALSGNPDVKEAVIIGWGDRLCLMKENEILEPFYASDGRITPKFVKDIKLQMSFSLRYDYEGGEDDLDGSFYRLAAALKKGKLKEATDFLFLPEYVYYRLTGKKVHEISLARSNDFVDARKNEYSIALLHGIGIPPVLAPELTPSFSAISPVSASLKEELGKDIAIRLGGSRDYCASFIVPSFDDVVYLRFGDSAVIGAITKGAYLDDEAREKGYRVGCAKETPTIEKRIYGHVLISKFLREVHHLASDYEEEIAKSDYTGTFDYEDEAFFKAESIKSEIDLYCRDKEIEPPVTEADYLRCIYLSLAEYVRKTVRAFEEDLGVTWGKLVLMNTEDKSPFLISLLERKIGKDCKIYPVPIEAISSYEATLQRRDEEEAERRRKEEEEE